jgi:hypothetical protein
MSDTDTVGIDEPQTYIISAFAAARFYRQLAQQAPAHNVQVYLQQASDWTAKAKELCQRYGMKQMPITRNS